MESRRITKALQRKRKPKPKPGETAVSTTEFRSLHPVHFYKVYRGASRLITWKGENEWCYVKLNQLAFHCEHCPKRHLKDRVRKQELVPHLKTCKGLKHDDTDNMTEKYHPEDVFYNPTELQAREDILDLPITYRDPKNDWLDPLAEVENGLQVLTDRIAYLKQRLALTLTVVSNHLLGKISSDMAAKLPSLIAEQKRLNEDVRIEIEALENSAEQESQDGETSRISACVQQKDSNDGLDIMVSAQEHESYEELEGFGQELVVDPDETLSGAWSVFTTESNLEKLE